MLDLNELQHFIAFSDLGTLTKVSEHFHISTPSITRSMQHIEEAFGVTLFSRSKNKIILNETGKKAVECAKSILKETEHAIHEVQDFDKAQKTIVVKSCAPAPLWQLLPTLSSSCPEMTISSTICQNEEALSSLKNGNCDIAILPYKLEEVSNCTITPYMDEHLYLCIKKEHQLANRKEVSFSDINGFNFLLRSELGFWDTLCREKMPASKFLVQNNEFEFNELVTASSLPCFATDIGIKNGIAFHDRICIPITDKQANVTFYLYLHTNCTQNNQKLQNLLL